MAISVADVRTRLKALLNDDDGAHWDNDFLNDSINEAQHAVTRLLAVSVKPGLGKRAEIDLSGTALCALPADVYRLVGVIGNKGGRGVGLKTIDELNRIDPCWQTADAIAGVEFYAYSAAVANELWVYPGKATGKLYINYIPKPDVSGNALSVGDEYINDIINFCLYRAYQREGVEGNWQSYRTAFYQGLGYKLELDEKFMRFMKDEEMA